MRAGFLGQFGMGQESEHIQPVVDRDDDHAFGGEM